jgi:hypothetical protein
MSLVTVLHRLAPEPRLPRRYVGRHRAPEHMRYTAVARVGRRPSPTLPPA